MPGKSGYEVMAEVCASSRWNDLIPVVLLTAWDSYSIEKSRAAGARMFMQKPANLDKLSPGNKRCNGPQLVSACQS